MSCATVHERFLETAHRRGAAPFLHVLEETAAAYGIGAGDISYRQMQQAVDGWIGRLRSAGCGPGHRVGLLLQNRPVFLEIWLALNALGASAVPINPDLRLAELEYLIAHSEMVMALVLPDRLAEVRQAAQNTGRNIPVLVPEDSLAALEPARGPALAPDSHTEAALLYTSGTTGRPKGCILSNEYFLQSGDWYAALGGHVALRPDCERMLTPLPLFHMNALAASTMAMITTGGCLILLDRFHPRTWWQSVRASRATAVHYLGVMPAMLISAPPDPADRDHQVRFGFGAGVEKTLHADFETRYGFPLIEAWACTETGNGGVICANEEPRKIGTACIGRPAAEVAIRIVDDSGNPVEDGAPGELLIRRAGDNPRYGFFSGYLKDPEATAALWEGGWLRTGDLVRQDPDGALHFVDRKKNLIRRSGENIAAVEVEEILNRHPAIRLSAVAAAPDKIRGDEVAAFVVLEAGDGTQAQAEAIVDWALEQMAYYKVPGWVAFVERLPLTATQKVLRGELRGMVSALFDKGAFFDTRHKKKRRI